jgi:hypothetical protein
MDTYLDSIGDVRKKDSLPVLAWSGNPCYTGVNHRLRGFGGSSAGATSEKLQSGLENRAAGRGDGFRSGGGEQVSKARKRRYAQTTILFHRKAAGHPAAFRCRGATPERWERSSIL